MVFFLRHRPVVLLLPVIFLPSCFWKEIQGDVTASPSVPVVSPPSSQPPWTSSTVGQLPLPPSSPSGGPTMLSPSSSPPGAVQSAAPPSSSSPLLPSTSTVGNPPSLPSPPGALETPGPPSSSTDGPSSLPPSSSPGDNPSTPLSPPSITGAGQPPGPSSSSTDGQLPIPPSSSPGENQPSPPSPPGAVHPPGPPSSSTDGQLPLPPSSSPWGNLPSPQPPGPPLSSTDGPSSLPPSSSPSGNPPSPPSPPDIVHPPGPPSSSTDGPSFLPPSSSPGDNPSTPPFPPSPPGAVHPPGPPSSSTDGQPSSPSSFPPGLNPQTPPSPPGAAQPPGPSSFPGGNPPTPPSPPGGGTTIDTTGFTHGTPAPFPTEPPPPLPVDIFLLSSLRPRCSPDAAPTDDSLGPRWDEDIRLLTQRCFLTYTDFQRYSCQDRCGVDERDISVPLLSNAPRCFCDNICSEFGDCCFDFDALCLTPDNPVKTPSTSNETCLPLQYGYLSAYTSFAAWKTCPQNWTDHSVRQKCQDENPDDLLRNLPVFDMNSHVTYRNVFCARCNGAVNTSYWSFLFGCVKWFNITTFNFSSGMDFLRNNCSLQISALDWQHKYLKRCIPRSHDCSSIISQDKNESYCQTECLRYAFPVGSNKEVMTRFGNLQCGLCNGFKLSELECDPKTGSRPVTPSLSILFDFSSTSISIRVYDHKEQATEQTEQFWSCASDEVYDPYTSSCKKVSSPGGYDSIQQMRHNKTLVRSPNCTFIAFNETEYKQLSNGSVYLKPHNKTYSNTTYTIRDNSLLLCVEFSRFHTTTEKKRSGIYNTETTPVSTLRFISSIGCIVSMVSLVLLLITYILFAELRNLPGKIIINLALSLLLYQSVFFSANKTDDQDTCLAIAVLLHYFVLSSFMWMNVMAYDVHRIFTPSDGVVANRHGSYKRRLIMYCIYAWGTPAVVVIVCVTVDHLANGSIGYGQGENGCFISQPQALLYSFVLPVALLILYNLYALGHIMIRIVKTRKETQQITNQRHGTNIALICVKMASVMGVTWILGIAANMKALAFLWYPYVVLNSLQGLFIFLSFAVSGRALELYRNKMTSIGKSLTTKKGENKRSTSGDYGDTLDTRL